MLISVHIILLYLYDVPVKVAFADSIISNGVLAVSSLVIINTLRYYLPTQNQFKYVLALCLLSVILWYITVSSILPAIIGSRKAMYPAFFYNTRFIRILIALLINGCVSLMGVAWYVNQKREQEDKRKTEIEELARKAELFNLRQQLQPHFLFNSLNSINALISMDPAMARKMVLQLSDFLRGTIGNENQQMVSLQTEYKHLSLYLEIEKVRFGHRLQTSIELEESITDVQIPKMLLQPLVENAIKFGLYNTTGDVEIAINAVKKENNVLITVKNPFDDDAQTDIRKGTGFGLSSVLRRLQLIYHRSDLLKTKKENNTFTVQVLLPIYNNYDESSNNR
ncbi:sensor histidine kinase [Polluticaenibacter yanchengensis]|uniref:Histidine kinase n=1 Tax=Polluticaenibacter yanchengensis TaxID=3014562 RepID=A0ABT4UF45_9BACT|nr:histidine kinase [Chitinophagaceae bacterium LY-5]